MKNKFKFIIPAIVTLFPMLFGIIVWDKLPETVAVHWGPSGVADGFANKGIAVFLFPLLFVVIYVLCLFHESKFGKNESNEKFYNIFLWIVPVLSFVCNSFVYLTAFGKEISVPYIMVILFSSMFVILGNYLPKMKQSRTMGIKIKWTLEDEGNWNATHRFSGKVWVIGGLLNFATLLLPTEYIFVGFIVVLVAMVSIPTIYSYNYYKKHK